MKKITLLTFALLLCITGIQAQKLKEGSLDFLKEEKELNVIFDYSETRTREKSAADFFVEANAKKPDWETRYKEAMMQKFIAEINNQLPSNCKAKEGSQNSKYQLIVKVLTIDADCNTKAEILITSTDSKENILARISVYGTAGRFGTFANLCGDAMKRIGKKTGKFIAKK